MVEYLVPQLYILNCNISRFCLSTSVYSKRASKVLLRNFDIKRVTSFVDFVAHALRPIKLWFMYSLIIQIKDKVSVAF